MFCEKCGYQLQPFDSGCPRCARWRNAACSLCGSVPVAALCSRCDAEICDRCTVSTPAGILCSTCAARQGITTPQPSQQPAAYPPVPAYPRGVSGPGEPTGLTTAAGTPQAPPAYVRAVSLSSVRPGTGFFDSVSRAFSFISQSMSMAFEDKDLLLPPFFSLLGACAVLGVFLGVAHTTRLLNWLLRSDHPAWQALLVLVSLAFAIYAVAYFFTGMTVNLVDSHLKGREARLGEAFADAVNNLGALLWLALTTTAVNLATAAVRGARRGRVLEAYAAEAVGWAWLVASFLILPAIIIEDRPFRQAVQRAWQLHSSNLLPIAVGEIGVVVVTRLLGFLAFLVAALLGFLLWEATHTLILPLVVAGLLLAFVSAFNMFVRTAYYTCLFLWAVEIERVGATAPVPSPLAPVLAPV